METKTKREDLYYGFCAFREGKDYSMCKALVRVCAFFELFFYVSYFPKMRFLFAFWLWGRAYSIFSHKFRTKLHLKTDLIFRVAERNIMFSTNFSYNSVYYGEMLPRHNSETLLGHIHFRVLFCFHKCIVQKKTK